LFHRLDAGLLLTAPSPHLGAKFDDSKALRRASSGIVPIVNTVLRTDPTQIPAKNRAKGAILIIMFFYSAQKEEDRRVLRRSS